MILPLVCFDSINSIKSINKKYSLLSPKIIINITETDYSDFLAECDSHNLTPEEKIREIITCYVILRRNRRKLPQKVLDPFLSAINSETNN
jgi:hypothetical protein